MTEYAGLIYTSDVQPGITRKRSGRGFTYTLPSRNTVKSTAIKERIAALAIPPAYTDVWISSKPNGHIQATGYDERGRKQYIYHPQWRKLRDREKFDRLIPFGANLPRIRARIQYDMKKDGLPKEKVVATVIALLDKTMIRIGNTQYAQENKSYGLTTMRKRHTNVTGSAIRFRFRGKRDKKHDIDLDDPRLARIVRTLHELPGQHLFQYEDETGARAHVGSTDVNNYLHIATGEAFTAKDFRTWHASLHAAIELHKAGPVHTEKQAQEHVRNMLQNVAEKLGNTPAICRSSYVHPCIIETYTRALSLKRFGTHTKKQLEKYKGAKKHEANLLVFLTAHAKNCSVR